MNPPSTFPNVVCWNAESRQQVVNTEALRVRESIFHATHFPSPIERMNPMVRPPTSEPYSEERLLKDFMESTAERVFCVVTGDPGTGKSHLVRWLWREIETRRNDRWKIVRVARHAANLADVLNQILDKDFHGEAVKRIREDLQQASNHTHAGAMQRVLDELAFVIDPLNRDRSQLEFPDNADVQEVILPLLPALLRDHALRAHLTRADGETIVQRLAHHVMGNRDRRSDPAQRRWVADDLSFPAAAIERAGKEVRGLASALLQDPTLRQAAAEVLTQAFAEAGPALVGLKRGNLHAAMMEIRRQLKSAGRELLLFIEDLSVSQGVDAELVESLLVTPAPGDGGADLCVLRSVVGVTNQDFQHMLDNIRGRMDLVVSFDVTFAERSQGGFSDGELADFASRYLNTARYALTKLDSWAEGNRERELETFCVASACPNREECHSVFGEVDGRGLYPFNKTALSRLYRNLHGSDVRAFNPRLLVRSVLQRILEEAEVQLPGKSFPPASFLTLFQLESVGTEMQVALRSTFGEFDAGRWRTALEMYAKLPNRGTLPKGLPAKFSLLEKKLPTTQPITPESEPVAPAGPARPVADDPYTVWNNTGRLDDGTLNTWRIAVFKALHGARDWDSEEVRPWFLEHFQRKYIHFEGQSSGQGGDIKIVIKRSPEHAQALQRLVTGAGNRESLRLAIECTEAWLADIGDQLRKRVRTTGQPKPLASAVHLLALGAMLRDAIPETASTEEFLLAVLKEWPTAPLPASGRSVAWNQISQAFANRGTALRDWLLAQIGGAKGGSVNAVMIETARIFEDVKSAERRVTIEYPDEALGKWDEEFFAPVIELAKRTHALVKTAIEDETQYCRQWLELLDAARGKQSIRELGEQLAAVLQAGGDAAIFDEVGCGDLQTYCVAFTDGSVDQLARIARAATAKSVALNQQLRVLAQVNRPAMAEAAETLRKCDQQLKRADEYLTRQLAGRGGDELEQLEKSAREALAALRQNLQTILGGEES